MVKVVENETLDRREITTQLKILSIDLNPIMFFGDHLQCSAVLKEFRVQARSQPVNLGRAHKVSDRAQSTFSLLLKIELK